MKIGKLYKAKQFHPDLDDGFHPDFDYESEFKILLKRGWDPQTPWVLSLNQREEWNIGPAGEDWIEIAPGQLVMVITVAKVPENDILDVGMLINDKRYAASFHPTEWANRFEEVECQ